VELVVLTFGLVFSSVYGLSNLLLNPKLKSHEHRYAITKTTSPGLRNRKITSTGTWHF
jgi:hypothetical protein